MQLLTLGVGQIYGRHGCSQEDRSKQGRRKLEPILADDANHVPHSHIGQGSQALGQPDGLFQQFQITQLRTEHPINLVAMD